MVNYLSFNDLFVNALKFFDRNLLMSMRRLVVFMGVFFVERVYNFVHFGVVGGEFLEFLQIFFERGFVEFIEVNNHGFVVFLVQKLGKVVICAKKPNHSVFLQVLKEFLDFLSLSHRDDPLDKYCNFIQAELFFLIVFFLFWSTEEVLLHRGLFFRRRELLLKRLHSWSVRRLRL